MSEYKYIYRKEDKKYCAFTVCPERYEYEEYVLDIKRFTGIENNLSKRDMRKIWKHEDIDLDDKRYLVVKRIQIDVVEDYNTNIRNLIPLEEISCY